MVSAILSGGTSSRLFIELREKNAFTYDVNAQSNGGIDFGYFSISCALKERNLAKAQKLIFGELDRLRTERVSIEELQKCKNIIMGSVLRGMDNFEECPEILAFMEIQFRRETALADYLERVKEVSSEDIMDVANLLKPDELSTALLKPKK